MKCFKYDGIWLIASQCVNKKTMVALDNDKYATASESESDNDMPPLENASDGEEHPAKGKEFVMVSR